MPRGCNDAEMPWGRESGFKDTKYAYVVHAELNAILNSPRSLKNTTLYVSLFPCNECAKAIIQAGIKKIYYESDKYDGTDGNVVSKMMLKKAGVEFEQLPYSIELELRKKDN